MQKDMKPHLQASTDLQGRKMQSRQFYYDDRKQRPSDTSPNDDVNNMTKTETIDIFAGSKAKQAQICHNVDCKQNGNTDGNVKRQRIQNSEPTTTTGQSTCSSINDARIRIPVQLKRDIRDLRK